MPPPSFQFSRAASGVLACALALAFSAGGVVAQHVSRIPWSIVEEVMPGAYRFSDAAGDPPVISGYTTGPDGEEVLHGYVFLTSDLPPEQYGYSGPIEVLVGMTPGGTLTGVHVTDYRESYMRSMGDFLKEPGFQEQFAGKYIGDPFRLWGDIEGISRVSITVRAMSRGVRDSARRVAAAYGDTPDIMAGGGDVTDPIGRSWFELRQLGIVRRFEVTEPGEGSAGIAVAHISSDRIGEYFFGAALYERALRAVERRGGADNLMLYSVDGSRLRLFRREGWSVEQDGDTLEIDSGNIVMLGLPSGGVVSGEATMVGLMLIDRAIDMSRPFTFVYDLGDLGVHTMEYVTREARTLIAEAEAEAEAQAEAAEAEASARAAEDAVRAAALEEAARIAEPAPEVEPIEPSSPSLGAAPAANVVSLTEEESGSSQPTAADGPGDGEPADDELAASAVLQEFDFAVTEDETQWARMLADTSWGRVATTLAVLSLGSAAFFLKLKALRWVALSVTLVVLGFMDGGFLSVSHITSAIWAGPGIYLRDLPLLLMVAFTVVTTLVWGRVFCGFLCPFGALQDMIDRIVPRRFQRSLPQGVHDRARFVKYGVLAIIVIPALAGSHVSLYQYFEPFGTVFFRSPSLLLWAIAGAFLAASVVIPRFYCRYACPLGAALGIVSLISLRRIDRVEQCDHCKVCAQKCPTGAIRGATIDFTECVRCNVCEVELIERTGVCRHDMEFVRSRLVQIEVGAGVGGNP